jgi:hypothetical protein
MEEGKDFLTQWQEYTDKILKELLNSDQPSHQPSDRPSDQPSDQAEQKGPLKIRPDPNPTEPHVALETAKE